MKFNELKNKVEGLGYKFTSDTLNDYKLVSFVRPGGDGDYLYRISGNLVGIVYSNTANLLYLSDDDRVALLKLAYEYASTPLNEREDESKFYVKMLSDDGGGYLNNDLDSGILVLNDHNVTEFYKTLFTQSEYNKLQHKYPDWLPKFDKNDPHFEFMEENK